MKIVWLINCALYLNLFSIIRENRYQKFDEKKDYDAHVRQFKGKKDRLISEWETQTGQRWPTYEALNKRTGQMETRRWEAHHVNPQQLGGKHKWWNVHPVHPESHQGGIHGSGSALNKILKTLGSE